MIAFMVVQAVVSTGEIYYVGFLGADALAGVAVSYPLVMLMTTLSAGGMGGGMASAIAGKCWSRAKQTRPAAWWYIPGDRGRDGSHLQWPASCLGGRSLFLLLWGGRGRHSTWPGLMRVLYLRAAITFWMFTALASVFRGTGDTARPAIIGTVGALLILAISPAFIFGFGPIPALGIAGAAWAVVVYNVACAAVLGTLLIRADSPIRPSR